MPRLPTDQIDHIKAVLDTHGELPPEWRWVLFPPEKQEYELVYAGKQREEDILANTMAVPLQPARTFGDTQAPWMNRLIFGDNLQAMQYLRGDPDVYQRVKLVYIDPPFATKQDFRGSEDQKAYQDKVAGAAFVEFIRARLLLIRELLHPAGSLYIHLDWRKSHYLKAILDEVFGEHRFMNQIIWQRHDPHNDAVTRYGRIHDVIFWYANQLRPTYNAYDIAEGLSPQAIREYSLVELPDGSVVPWQGEELPPGARRFKLDDCTVKGNNAGRKFTWRGAKPGSKRQWPVDSPEEMDAGLATGIYYLRNPERGALRCRKSYLDKRTEEGQLAQDIWLNLGRMKGGSTYPTEKPEVLLDRIIRASSDPGDLVMDAFAGSGTTLAVAEKLGRRWIGIDSGKLAIYTVQKRLLHLRAGIGNKSGAKLQPQPFTLYNAGLYDFASLRELPWESWRFFALRLFECKDRPHTIGTFPVDGERRGDPVMVFNWKAQPNAKVSEETIDDIHAAIGQKLGRRFYIIAPMQAFEFMQDYIVRDNVRYYALRIPYNFIQELHQRNFQAVLQARNATEVNDIQEAYGFSFIVPPEVEFTPGLEGGASVEVPPSGLAEVAAVDGFVDEEDVEDEEDTESLEEEEGDAANGNGHRVEQVGLFPIATITTKEFVSKSRVKGTERDGGKETLAMLLVDIDYDGQVFQMTEAFFGHQLEAAGWVARLNPDRIGKQVMAIWVDYHGNEFKAVIPRESFGLETLLADETADAPAIAPIGELSGS